MVVACTIAYLATFLVIAFWMTPPRTRLKRGKWVQLLKSVVPGLRRAAFLFNPEVAPYAGEFVRYAEGAAAPLTVEIDSGGGAGR